MEVAGSSPVGSAINFFRISSFRSRLVGGFFVFGDCVPFCVFFCVFFYALQFFNELSGDEFRSLLLKFRRKMLVAFEFVRAVSRHLADDGIGDAFHKQRGRGEMTEVVNSQILDTR
ncbi:MAG TPA: hypothetical protein VGC97_11570 [Pyrinomonadaceae bacterium]